MQLTASDADPIPLTRRTLLGIPLLAMLGASLRTGETAPSGRSAIPMYRGNPARTGEHPGPGPGGEPAARWQVRLGGVLSSSPAVVDGLIYIGSVSPGTVAGGALHAIDETGVERWRLPTVPGDGIFASAAVVDGVAVVGSYDGIIIAAAADSGQELWRFGAETSVFGSPAVVDGTVYVGDSGGHLYALGAADGEERWRLVSGDGFERALSTPAVVAGVVYCVSASRQTGEIARLEAVDAVTGEERWRFTPDDSSMLRATPVVAEGRIHIGTRERVIHTVDAATGEPIGRLDLGVVMQTELAVVEGVTYVGAGGALHAVDAATGRRRWSSQLSDHDLRSGPTVAAGVVYVGAADGTIYAVDAVTGEQRWQASVGSLRSSPAIIGGVLYVGSTKGYLRAVMASS